MHVLREVVDRMKHVVEGNFIVGSGIRRSRPVGAMVQIYCKGLLSAEVNSICAEQRGCVWAFPVARLPLSRKRRWACRRHNMDIGGLKEAEKEEPLGLVSPNW